MTPKLPASSRKCRETRPTRAALLKRPSGRSRLLRNDPSTTSSPATTAADPDKPGRPRSDRQTHNHSPPTWTAARVQISDTCSDEEQRASLRVIRQGPTVDLHVLRFEVRDDGAGFDPNEVAGGVGFTSMRDCLAA